MSYGQAINLRASIWRGKRIGLLGGSFNPAHRGHLLISKLALVHLSLDEVWWLVSPDHPIKATRSLKPLSKRLESARNVARHPNIRVTDIEQALGTRFTVDTLEVLTQTCPKTHFVWLMGADNMIQLPDWWRWERLFELVPIAVFGRPNYSLRAMTSMVAKRYARHRIGASKAPCLALARPPAWTFIHYRHDPISATVIRKRSDHQ